MGRKDNKKIILAYHYNDNGGATLLTLKIGQELRGLGYQVFMVCTDYGPNYWEALKIAPCIITKNKVVLRMLFRVLKLFGYRRVFTNSVVAGHIAEVASETGMRTVSLIHELLGIINKLGVKDRAEAVRNYSDYIVFPNHYVEEAFISQYPIEPKSRIVIRGQGLYKKFSNTYTVTEINKKKAELGIPLKDEVVIGIGLACHRKGTDLFIKTAKAVRKIKPNTSFIWIGAIGEQYESYRRIGLAAGVKFVSHVEDPEIFYRMADLYLLTSREDPFPSVVLEAIYCGVPVIGFDEAGGFRELPERFVKIVPFEDTDSMSNKICEVLSDGKTRDDVKTKGEIFIRKYFSFKKYVKSLLELFDR